MTDMPSLKRSLEIDAPPEEVWHVLTNPELVREWAAVYLDGVSVRTTWREGEPITWKAADGAVQASGAIAACEPERLLKIRYEADTAFPETFEIVAREDRTWLNMSTGHMDDDDLQAVEQAADDAIREIKSLAEESAQIHGRR